MAADNDSLMLERLGNAIIDLQVKYRASTLSNRLLLRPTLEQLLTDFAAYQIKLIKEGVITSKEELEEMKAIAAEIQKAADAQKLMAAVARTVAFVAARV